MEFQIQKILKPIYQAIDLNQYSKALKLTQNKPQNIWPITIALRCHCLERCGPARYREACLELKSLLRVLGDEWSELDEKIWLLSLDSSLPDANCGIGNTKAGKPNANSSTTGKKKNFKKGSKASKVPSASKPTPTQTPSNSDLLDAVDVLDLHSHQRQHIIQMKMNGEEIDTNALQIDPFEITDEHTIATLAISITALRLPRTCAKLYSYAIQHVQKVMKTQPTNATKEQLCALLIQGFLTQLKMIATMPSFSPSSIEEKLENARSTLKAWEEAQILAMTLLKNTGENLHQSWLILSVLEHYHSCQSLMKLLENRKGECDSENVDSETTKLTQKVGMLPRLAEMMTMKQIKAFKESDGSTKFSPSVDDVRLYIETLQIQSKYEVALEFLEQLGFKESEDGESTKVMSIGRKIDDENDVKHHRGSLIQMTEKEAFEMKVKLLLKLNRNDEAFKIYSGKLLPSMPDQWSYWEEMLKCADLYEDKDQYIESCNEVLNRVLREEENKKLEGKGPNVPLRAPHLFSVEMAGHCLNDATISKENALTKLSQTIVSYGEIFAPKVNCCFQDIRKYIHPLVHKSRYEDVISAHIQDVLCWALKLRCDHSPIKFTDGDETPAQKQERRSKLRAFIASVKICFEIWFQLLDQCEGDSMKRKKVDEAISRFVPAPDEMIAHWNSTMDLGSNPKDGGQKEYLPGDDLILLTVQLLLKNESNTTTNLHVAALLENAIHHSPYNPYLKLAAINIHVQNKSATRAWEIFQDMNIKQIQLDSCSYFIVRHLMNAGLYKEVIEQTGKIIRLHSSSEKDILSYMGKALNNGNLHKGREMIQWQRKKMTLSLQLLEAKGLIMDLAPLSNIGTDIMPIGSIHGLCGGENDVERAEKIIRDSTNSNSAPSFLHLASENENTGCDWSDNRDFDVNQYEILRKTTYPLPPTETFVRAHLHAVLTRLVLFIKVVKQPKKGKIAKVKEGETLDNRSKSLWQAIEKADAFLLNNECHMSGIQNQLSKCAMYLSKAICVVGSGRCSNAVSIHSADSLAFREEQAIAALKMAHMELSKLSESTESSYPRKILPDVLITTFAIFKITANICATFGWGKRKRQTKPAAGSLADVAEELNNLVVRMIQEFDANDATSNNYLKNELFSIEQLLLPSSNAKEIAEKVVDDIILSEKEVRRRLLPIFNELVEEFRSFDIAD